MPAPATDRRITAAISRWFARSARPLPWRTTPRDPYRSLVSEIMLQQTQVSRVLERFDLFLARFPTVDALAAAPERDALALWSGLGYYSRARNLHAAAKAIVEVHGGCIPESLEELLTLPGVGRYTAGAIASMVFGQPAPIVDGNVTRVLLRIEGRSLAHGSPQALRWAWRRSEQLVAAARTPALFNEGLMELGATICTPRNPSCDRCPLRNTCRAREQGAQHRIPRPKQAAARRALHCASVLLRDSKDRLLVEPRAPRGLWASLWQAPTLESPDTAPDLGALHDWLGIPRLKSVSSFRHGTTHRSVVFHVWQSPPLTPAAAKRLARNRPTAEWLAPAEIAALPLSNPQRRILLASHR
jgi:A/G-specific adenine glycosylase